MNTIYAIHNTTKELIMLLGLSGSRATPEIWVLPQGCKGYPEDPWPTPEIQGLPQESNGYPRYWRSTPRIRWIHQGSEVCSWRNHMTTIGIWRIPMKPKGHGRVAFEQSKEIKLILLWHHRETFLLNLNNGNTDNVLFYFEWIKETQKLFSKLSNFN